METRCDRCKAKYDSNKEFHTCPVCLVEEKLWDLFSPILLSIQCLSIGPSILTLNDATRALHFSGRQEVKHNRIHNSVLAYNNLKQTYILSAAAIEEHFNNIKHFKAAFNVDPRSSKVSDFSNMHAENFLFKGEQLKPRFKNITSFIWNAQNVFKHCNGRLDANERSSKTIKEKYLQKYEKYSNHRSFDLEMFLMGGLLKQITDEPCNIDPRNLAEVLFAVYIYCLDSIEIIYQNVIISKINIRDVENILCETDYKDEFLEYLKNHGEFYY